MKELKIRGRIISTDAAGSVCLNDIWAAAGFSKNQRPHDWGRLSSTAKLIEAILTKVTGKSRNWTKEEIKSVLYVKNGVGTYADVRLALSYAEYLNPKLALGAAVAVGTAKVIETAAPSRRGMFGLREAQR